MAARRPYLLILLPLALAACGGSAKPKTVGAGPIDAAVTKTLAQGSEKVTISGKVNLAGQAISLSGGGAFSRTAGKLHLSLDVPLLGSSTLDVLIAGASTWIKSPLLASSLHGKQWLLVDLAKAPAKVFGIDLTPLLLADSPTSLLDQLDTAVLGGSGVEEIGSETVGGVSTTHYRVDVGTTSVKRLQATEDAWIDGQNLVRKLSYDSPVSVSGKKTAPAVLTMTLSDFGTSVAVTPPPAAQVAAAGTVGK